MPVRLLRRLGPVSTICCLFGGKGNPSAGAGGVPLPPKPPIPSPARFYCGRVRKTRNARPQKHAERIAMGSLTRRNDLPICGNSSERPACRACYRSDRAFSVGNASRCKPYGQSSCGKNAVFPLTLGRAALCRRLFPYSKLKRFRLPCGNACFPRHTAGGRTRQWRTARQDVRH